MEDASERILSSIRRTRCPSSAVIAADQASNQVAERLAMEVAALRCDMGRAVPKILHEGVDEKESAIRLRGGYVVVEHLRLFVRAQGAEVQHRLREVDVEQAKPY